MHTFKHLQILPLLMSTLRATLSNRHRTDENCMGAKVGIIGCGRWGSVHIKTLFQLKQEGLISEIHGCDINPQKGDEFADLLTTFSTDWQELVSREKLDVIAIVTPVETHHKLAISLLDHCTNLFIEKPISLQENEAAQILAKTQEVGGNLLVGHILRFHAGLLKANDFIQSGTIGQLQSIDFSRITTRKPPHNSNLFEALAIHGIDTACFCFGETEPSRLSIDSLRSNADKSPNGVRICLEFPGTKEALIDVGWNGEKEVREIILTGSKGSITVDTKDSHSILISTSNYHEHYFIEDTEKPLTTEWRHALAHITPEVNPAIYPAPGSIFRSMKWMDKAKLESERINYTNGRPE